MVYEYRMRCEINIEMPEPDTFGELARRWLDDGYTSPAGDHRRALEAGPKLPPEAIRRSMPCGPPGAAWGFVSIDRPTERGYKDSGRVYSTRSWKWFLTQLADPPLTATIGTSVLDEDGYPGKTPLRIYVQREREAMDYVRFCFLIPEAAILEPDTSDRVLEFVQRFLKNVDPNFGILDFEHDGMIGRTASELTVAGDVPPGPLWLFPEDTIPENRTLLRGYRWITVLPAELVSKLGGVAKLKRSGSFYRVQGMAGGAAWLQATQYHAEYQEDQINRVFRTLAPLLRPGKPLREEDRPGLPPFRIAMEDAASVQ